MEFNRIESSISTADRSLCVILSLLIVSGESIDWPMDLDYEVEEKLKELSIEPQNLSVQQSEPIGRGNFGVIYMGQLLKDDKCITVAVKTLRGEYPHVLCCHNRCLMRSKHSSVSCLKTRLLTTGLIGAHSLVSPINQNL